MADAPRATWITGIGIVSCLGEGAESHWRGLNSPPPQPDFETWTPYGLHRLAPIELDRQIPKKGDQRQMESWQRTGTYAAGLALESAGAKGNAELLAHMDMIVAAGGGERDQAVDLAVMAGLVKSKSESFLNERLMSDLRPTLFLAQLSNLLAGNISIVHGVTGSSRTFMGEEAAGVDAVRIAHARIVAGQSDIALVGGGYNADRLDLFQHAASGNVLSKGAPARIWDHAGGEGGTTLGSLGAFLVLEGRDHAQARGAKPLARLASVQSNHAKRQPGAIRAALERQWAAVAPHLLPNGVGIISGATGFDPPTAEEREFLAGRGNIAVRATNPHLGHANEPQFAMNLAIATIALGHSRLFAPSDQSGFERAMDTALRQVVVTSVGLQRGEGLALVEAAG